jgi:ubiquinone biosynthesis protein
MIADGLRKQAETLKMIPDIIRRLDDQLPKKGGAPEAPPLPPVKLIWDREGKRTTWWRYALVALGGAGATLAVQWWV